MVTWLTRSLLFIVAGAILAFAITVHTHTIDLQRTGVILLLVGIFDLLLNVGVTMYWDSVDRTRRASRAYPDLPSSDLTDTRVIRRGPNWH